MDKAILGDEHDMFKPIMELKPDIIVLGHDQHFNEKWLEEELKKRGLNTRVVRIKAKEECEFCSSTRIIKRVAELAKKRVEEYDRLAVKKEVKKEVTK